MAVSGPTGPAEGPPSVTIPGKGKVGAGSGAAATGLSWAIAAGPPVPASISQANIKPVKQEIAQSDVFSRSADSHL